MTEALIRLVPGEDASCDVAARKRWNETGIEIEAGALYVLRAGGTWYDRRSAGSPDGLAELTTTHRIFSCARRARLHPWFALITAVGRGRPLLAGSEARIGPEASGPLRCYANDFWFAYGNNSGSVRLTVTRSS